MDHNRDTAYLNGDWTPFPEDIVHATSELGYVLLRYSARNANAVLGALNGKPIRLRAELDSQPLTKD